jgi:UPF0755 protein
MARDPRVDKLQRLRTERVTRASGGYYGTRATAYGNVRSGPRQRDMGRTLLSLVLFVVVMAVALYLASQYITHGYRTPVASNQREQTVTVTIPQGESASQLATLLQDKGIVGNSTVFDLYLRWGGANWTAGPHTLRTGMSFDEIVRAISTTPVIPVATVRIHEGWRAEQVAQALADANVATYADVMNEVQKGNFQYSFLSDRPPGATLEGYLFPDTYKFPQHESAHLAIGEILRNFDQKVASATNVVAQGKQRYGGSFYKTIIMASIVEREAGTNHDRYLIASVYYNRLHDATRQFINFDADPTVQYILGSPQSWWPQITQGDIARTQNNPLNTYHHPGLPLQPIASPSLASIEASVNPPTTSYMSFTHRNGSHGMSSFCTAQQGFGTACNTTPQ